MQSQTSTIELIIDGHNALKKILSCIEQAQQSIRIRMFMWRDDETGNLVLDALKKKIQQVPCIQIIIEKDVFGSRMYDWQKWISFGKKRGDIFSSTSGIFFLKQYKKNVIYIPVGSKSLLFFKILKENDHSKVFVFDETTGHCSAIVGGMNIGNEYLLDPDLKDPSKGGWHDYMVYLEGADANRLLPHSPKEHKQWLTKKVTRSTEILFNIKDRRRMRREILGELSRAKTSIIIEHGYLTDEFVILKLRKLARKGISITIIMPDRSDGFYNANMHSIHKLLRKTIIRKAPIPNLYVYLYPGMIHAKLIIIDKETTIIGSANLTVGSFQLLNETNAIFRTKRGVTQKLLTQLQTDVKRCTLISSQKEIPPYSRFRARIERIFI